MERKRLFSLFTAVCAVVIAAALLYALVAEHWRTESPDHGFVAVAQVERLYALISTLPGRGGDKPGYVTVYRGSRSCGSAWVPVISLTYALRWDVERKPRRAEILTATWNLDECRIERLFSATVGTGPTKAAAGRHQAA